MNCSVHLADINPLETKKVFCGLDDLFTNFDRLQDDTLNLGLDNLHATIMNINDNLNPTHHCHTSEIHGIRLVYKKPCESNPYIKTFYGIGYLLYPNEKADKAIEFVTDEYPLLYAFTTYKNTCIQVTYAPAKDTFEEFCEKTPLVLYNEGSTHPISYLNQRDGDFVQEVFRYAKTNKKQLKDLVVEQGSRIFPLAHKANMNLKQAINHLFTRYREIPDYPQILLSAAISKQLQYQLPIYKVNDKIAYTVHTILDNIFLTNRFLNIVTTRNNRLSPHEYNKPSLRLERFNAAIESTNFSTVLHRCIDEMIQDGNDPNHPINFYLHNPSPANRKTIFNLVCSRMIIAKAKVGIPNIATITNKPSFQEEFFHQMLLELVQERRILISFHQASEILFNQETSQNSQTQNTEQPNMKKSIKVIGSAIFPQENADNAVAVTENISAQTEALLESTAAPVETSVQNESVNISEAEAIAQAFEDSEAESVVELPPKESIYKQDHFNPLPFIQQEPLNLLHTINGSKQVAQVNVEDLTIIPFFIQVFNADTKKYEIQTHLLSLAYKEYFHKDKKEDGLINYLGFGHEILFDGNQFVAHEHTNIYVLHQRKNKLTSCGIINFLEFNYEKPYIIYLTAKKTNPQINTEHVSSKELLALTTRNHQAFNASANMVAEQITASFKKFLKENNRKSNIRSVMHFLGLELSEIEQMEFNSLTPEYYVELNPIKVEPKPVTPPTPVVETAPEPKVAPVNKAKQQSILEDTPAQVVEVLQAMKTPKVTPQTSISHSKTIFVDPQPDDDLQPVQVQHTDLDSLPKLVFTHTNTGKHQSSPSESSVVIAPATQTDASVVHADTSAAQAEVVNQENTSNEPVVLQSSQESSETQQVQPLSASDLLQHPFFTQLTSRDEILASETFQEWHYETELGYTLLVGLSQKHVKLNVVGCPEQYAIYLKVKHLLDREQDFHILVRMTNKGVAKTVRKFIKKQLKQNLFNAFKSV